MKYSHRISQDMQQLVKQYINDLQNDKLYKEFKVLAGYFNEYFGVDLFSLRRDHLQKHIFFYAKKLQDG